MPNPTQRDEREKLEKQKKPAPTPAPPKADISIGSTLKKINERKKLLDET